MRLSPLVLLQTYPIHVVCAWLGNSQRVAAKHYLQVTDADFDRATGGGAQSGAQDGKTAAQKQAQPMSANSGRLLQETHKALENQGLCHVLTKTGESWPERQVTPTGFEPVLQA